MEYYQCNNLQAKKILQVLVIIPLIQLIIIQDKIKHKHHSIHHPGKTLENLSLNNNFKQDKVFIREDHFSQTFKI